LGGSAPVCEFPFGSAGRWTVGDEEGDGAPWILLVAEGIGLSREAARRWPGNGPRRRVVAAMDRAGAGRFSEERFDEGFRALAVLIVTEVDRRCGCVRELCARVSRRAVIAFRSGAVGARIRADELHPARPGPVILRITQVHVGPCAVLPARHRGIVGVGLQPVVSAAQGSEVAGAGCTAGAIGFPRFSMVG